MSDETSKTTTTTVVTGPGALSTLKVTHVGVSVALVLPEGTGDLKLLAENAEPLLVHGIAAGLDKQKLTVSAIGVGTVEFVPESPDAAPSHRIANKTADSVTLYGTYDAEGHASSRPLPPAGSLSSTSFVYDESAQRWRQV